MSPVYNTVVHKMSAYCSYCIYSDALWCTPHQFLPTLIRLLPLELSDLGPYCLPYRLPKYKNRRERGRQLSWIVGKGLTLCLLVLSGDNLCQQYGPRCRAWFGSKLFDSDIPWERSGSVVECLTQDREAAGSSLTGVTVLWSLSKTHLS